MIDQEKNKKHFIQGSAFDEEFLEGGAEFDGDEAKYIEGGTSFDDNEITRAKLDAIDAIKVGIADAKHELQAIKTAYKGLPTLENKVSEEHRQNGLEKVNEGISSMAQIREVAKKRREQIQQRIRDRMSEIKELADADKELLEFSNQADADVADSQKVLDTIKREERDARRNEEQRKKEAKLMGVRGEERATLDEAVESVSSGTKEESVANFMKSDANAQEQALKGRNVIHAHGTVA